MVRWQWSSYSSLSRDEIYQILKLRQQVFVVEQNCVYLDADGLDDQAWHLMAWRDSDRGAELVAYLRVLFPGVNYAEPSLGRVVTAPSARGGGLGKQLTEAAIEHTLKEYPRSNIRISAQQYLIEFYRSFGFEAVSEPYDEDGIPHIEMLRRAEGDAR
ncbi:GNAT family N-acetyltransferase [Aestuariirhabdus sp. Z084]|uniref:GNAT family N-acetyltransferase n=1 Tax=Aestuariirhabdus haliotis TaxID=2918751 RepID=UPI00201B3D73|nr:GNAT family N-acetyltransferase [Aestuariirhabdus haliotis]MCL6417715.1 GNAT family N-acetyltransferase [Aestuariirhabdus haliotis]MCL6421654.1 GNAT family N-acetyltransferase [Aestuariirhabdus haliotis]